MKHSHHHPGPRGFRGTVPGADWFDGADHEGPGGPEARRRRGGFGPGGPGFGGPGFGGPGPGGRGRRGGRPRGDVRVAVLLLLADQPRHGYDLIREIEQRSGGAWVPSPGSIYPTLQSLEDEGLVTIEMIDGRKTARLTDAGEEWAAEHAGELEALFEVDDRKEHAIALRRELHELHEAVAHIARRYDRPEVAAKAAELVAATRRDLYRLLAEDGD